MKFTPNNFLQFVKQIVCGGGAATSGSTLKAPDNGFNLDVDLGLGNASLGSGTTMTTDSGGLHILSEAASSTALTIGTWGFIVPRDYDQVSDIFKIRVVAKMAGATDTPALTIATSTAASSTSQVGLSGLVYSSTIAANTAGSTATTSALSATAAIYEADLSAQKLTRDTLVTVKLTSAVHNTDAVQILAVQMVYQSCLVAWGDIYDRDVLGNYLRG